MQIDEQYAVAYLLKGNARYEIGQKEKAIDAFTTAASMDKGDLRSAFSLAFIYQEKKDFEKAISYYKKVMVISPSDINSIVNMGNCYQELKDCRSAMDHYDRALALDPLNPYIHYNKAQALYLLGRVDEAIQQSMLSLHHDPHCAKAYCNLGLCYADKGMYGEAMRCYRLSLHHDPHHHRAAFNMSLVQLLHGDYTQGWGNYERRFLLDPPQVIARHYPFPRLSGPCVDNKHLFLYAEQGLGDTIQFCRFAKCSSADRGAMVTLEVPQPLVGLLQTLDPRIKVVCGISQGERFDCHQSLLSLPRSLNLIVKDIPHSSAYLSASPDKKQQWSARLSGEKN
jgi:tetratricopeptide (TPR) repeat protein